MRDKTDRTIILRDTVVYVDKHGSRVFSNDLLGSILQTAYPGKSGHASDTVVSLTADGKSLAEIYANGRHTFLPGENTVWIEFANWLQNR